MGIGYAGNGQFQYPHIQNYEQALGQEHRKVTLEYSRRLWGSESRGRQRGCVNKHKQDAVSFHAFQKKFEEGYADHKKGYQLQQHIDVSKGVTYDIKIEIKAKSRSGVLIGNRTIRKFTNIDNSFLKVFSKENKTHGKQKA